MCFQCLTMAGFWWIRRIVVFGLYLQTLVISKPAFQPDYHVKPSQTRQVESNFHENQTAPKVLLGKYIFEALALEWRDHAVDEIAERVAQKMERYLAQDLAR